MRGTVLFVQTTFADALRSAIEAKGWTPYKLGKEAGVLPSSLSRYLSGETAPDDKMLERMIEKLDVDGEELRALADVHRLGPARTAGIVKYGPAAIANEPPGAYGPDLSKLPPALVVLGRYDHLIGDAPGLGAEEEALVERLIAFAGSERILAKDYNMGPRAQVWGQADRLERLKQMIDDLGVPELPVKAKGRKRA